MAAGARGDAERVEATAQQQAFARRVAESKATIPHAYFELDSGRDPSLAELIRASAVALEGDRRLNGAYRDGHFEIYPRINIGFAISAAGSTLVPVIRDADGKPLATIEREVAQLSASALAGELAAPALAGATFTVLHSPARAFPAVTKGQAAVLAAGGGALTLACDHRMAQTTEGPDLLARVRDQLGDREAL